MEGEFVERLVAEAVRPPEGRVLDGEGGADWRLAVGDGGAAAGADAAERELPVDLGADAAEPDVELDQDRTVGVGLADQGAAISPSGPTRWMPPARPAGARAMFQSQPKSHCGWRNMLPLGIGQLLAE